MPILEDMSARAFLLWLLIIPAVSVILMFLSANLVNYVWHKLTGRL